MRLRFPLLLLLLAAAPAGSTSAQAQRPDAAPPRAEQANPKGTPAEKDARSRFSPMVFYLARGEPDACGPGCSEWIAAEGNITRDAGQRLNEFLNTLGKRKLPIYFHSPGGSVGGAMGMGRLMRHWRMTAGVARTVPEGCHPLKDREPACDALKRSGRELRAQLRTARAFCSSACVYALVGAASREVAPGVRLGVHAMARRQTDADGMLKPPSRKLTPEEERKLMAYATARVTRYVLDMGVDKALVEAASQISHDRIRYLSRDEIARFGIDTRAFWESRWMADEAPSGPAVLKLVTEAKGDEVKSYRTTRVRLTCGSNNVLVFYDRELGPADRASAPIAVTTASGGFVLPPSRSRPVVRSNNIVVETRYAWVAFDLLEAAAGGKTFEIAETPEPSAPERVQPPVRLATTGLKSAISALRESCR